MFLLGKKMTEEREVEGRLTPRMPHDLIEGYLALSDLTSSGSLSATLVGGNLAKKAPRSFCFWGVSGGYLGSGGVVG